MYIYIATTNTDPYHKFGNNIFSSLEEAKRYADYYNMGADYSHMRVFTIFQSLKHN